MRRQLLVVVEIILTAHWLVSISQGLEALPTHGTTGSNLLTRRQGVFALLGCGTAGVLSEVPALSSLRPPWVYAAETVGKDPNCNDSSCLGVWDGLLADCPHAGTSWWSGAGKPRRGWTGGSGCTSSQDDTPGIFAEPWDYSESFSLNWEDQMPLLVPAIQKVCARRGDQVTIVTQEKRYLRVLIHDRGETSIGEFYFTPNDTTVQFRIAALDGTNQTGGTGVALRNLDRAELFRKELRYQKLPVLRNRQRTLFFVESEWDTFGPGSAALGPPAEMRTGELEGRADVDLRLKTDWIQQQFPR